MKNRRHWICLLLIGWVVVGMLPRAHAAEPPIQQHQLRQDAPTTEHLLFTSAEYNVHGLFMMDADGSGLRPLIGTFGFDSEGVFSPDGQWIAFVSARDDDLNGLRGRANYEIYVMRPDGSDVRRLTDYLAWDADPAWTTDSRTLYFGSDRGGDFGIYRVGLDDGIIEPVTPRGVNYFSPHISPDGTQMLVVTGRDGNSEISVMDLATLEERRLTTTEEYESTPRWSPDGSQIVYAMALNEDDDNTDLYVMNVDGTNVRQLTNHPEPDAWPAWSPDGTRIAFTSLRDWTDDTLYMAGMEIYVMDADGSNVIRLTNNAFQDVFPAWFPNVEVVLASEPTSLQFLGVSPTMPQGQAAIYYEEGLALMEVGDYEKAIGALTLAISFQHGSDVLYVSRAQAYYNFGNYEAAIEDGSQAITLNRFNAGGYWIRGLAYLETDLLARAISDGNKVVELRPDAYYGYGLLAQVHFELSNYQAARDNLELYIEYGGPATITITNLKAELEQFAVPTPTPTVSPPTATPELIIVPDTEAMFAIGTVLTVPGPAPMILRPAPSEIVVGQGTTCSPGMDMTVLQTVATPDGTQWVELECEAGTGWLDEERLSRFFP